MKRYAHFLLASILPFLGQIVACLSVLCGGGLALGENDGSNFVKHTDCNKDYIKEIGLHPEVFIDLHFYEPIELYSGSKKVKIKNDPVEEVYPNLTLISQTDSTYLVYVSNPLNGEEIACGDISKSTPLRIFSRKYRPDIDPLIIYLSPDVNSQTVKSNQEYDQLEVIGVKDCWLKIKVEVQGKIIEGWLPSEEQCANPYSTCS